MLLLQLEPPQLIALLTALVVGLTVHEFAHAWSAFRLGDLTAYEQGRLTLNPASHIDPFGALMMLVVGFGWARPVPINPYRLGKQGVLKVALAGPVSNILLALGASVAFRFTQIEALTSVLPVGIRLALGPDGIAASFLYFFIYLNVLLAVFNMLPIAPLDGWKVLMGLVPPSTEFKLRQFEAYGMMVLLILIFADNFIPGLERSLLWTIIGGPAELLVGLFTLTG